MELCFYVKPCSILGEPTSKKINEMTVTDLMTILTHTGSLLFPSTVTRLDMSHVVGILFQYFNEHKKEHWLQVKKIIRYLNRTQDYGIRNKTQYPYLHVRQSTSLRQTFCGLYNS